MATLVLSQIVAAVDAAYATAAALAVPTRVAAASIGDNASIQTDVYQGPQGSGFQVVAKITLGIRTIAVCKQSGPETWRNTSALTVAGINAAQKVLRAAAYVSRGCSDLDYVDAVTKQSSTDPAVKAAGDAQLVAVLAARLQVKADYPYLT